MGACAESQQPCLLFSTRLPQDCTQYHWDVGPPVDFSLAIQRALRRKEEYVVLWTTPPGHLSYIRMKEKYILLLYVMYSLISKINNFLRLKICHIKITFYINMRYCLFT